MASRSAIGCDCRLGGLGRSPNRDKARPQDHSHKRRGAVSRDDFVADEVEAQTRGGRAVEEVGGHGFADIVAQLVPSVGLGDDAFTQGLGDVAAVGLLGYFKDEFVHGGNDGGKGRTDGKAGACAGTGMSSNSTDGAAGTGSETTLPLRDGCGFGERGRKSPGARGARRGVCVGGGRRGEAPRQKRRPGAPLPNNGRLSRYNRF